DRTPSVLEAPRRPNAAPSGGSALRGTDDAPLASFRARSGLRAKAASSVGKSSADPRGARDPGALPGASGDVVPPRPAGPVRGQPPAGGGPLAGRAPPPGAPRGGRAPSSTRPRDAPEPTQGPGVDDPRRPPGRDEPVEDPLGTVTAPEAPPPL